jgi:hypothetical protein
MRRHPREVFFWLRPAFALIFLICAPCSAQLVLSSLTGDITPAETNGFVAYVNTTTPHTSNESPGDNALLVWRTDPWNIEPMRLMWESTGDMRLMNLLLKFGDPILAYRNDQLRGEQRPMWDQEIEPCWPNYPLPDRGAGCEQGDIVSHLAHIALDILRDPAIYNLTVPDGNPYRYGVTYKQRAMTYIKMCDSMEARYLTRWFVNPATLELQTPTDPRYEAAGQVTAWNRRMMLVAGYVYLAECHDCLDDHPAFLSMYKGVAKVNTATFLAAMTPYYSRGHAVYKWTYTTGSHDVEACEYHGEYDMWGLFEAYQSGYTSLTAAQMTVLANTAEYVIYQKRDLFGYYVDGSGTATTLQPLWICLAEFNRSLYTEIAQASIDAGNATGDSLDNSAILWMKHWLATH